MRPSTDLSLQFGDHLRLLPLGLLVGGQPAPEDVTLLLKTTTDTKTAPLRATTQRTHTLGYTITPGCMYEYTTDNKCRSCTSIKNHETTNSLDHVLLHFVRCFVLCPLTRPPRTKTRFSSDPAVFVLYLHEKMISKKKWIPSG